MDRHYDGTLILGRCISTECAPGHDGVPQQFWGIGKIVEVFLPVGKPFFISHSISSKSLE
jgi:hypothetical protein